MSRYVSLWLPHWPTDRWRLQANRPHVSLPLVLTERTGGALRIAAVDAAAAIQGLAPGMMLADARALVPELRSAEASPREEAEALGHLADWCGRYAPWVAVDGMDGIIIDVTGAAHLHGGEAGLLADLSQRLGRFPVSHRLAIADTPASAWALARYGAGGIVAQSAMRAALAALPVAALRIAPDTAEALQRLGLYSIGDVQRLPRGPLAARLGSDLLRRLDRLLGHEREPISPRRKPAAFRTRINFADCIARREDIDATLAHLLGRLVLQLADAGLGARQLELSAYRVDAAVQRIGIGTSRPSRDADHLMKLFRDKLDAIEPGFGIEAMVLEADATEGQRPEQVDVPARAGIAPVGNNAAPLAEVIDRLANRLGRQGVLRAEALDSHWPDRAEILVLPQAVSSPAAMPSWPEGTQRPIRLLAAPEPIDAEVREPGGPPVRFVWRRQAYMVGRAEGPERIGPEWWRADASRMGRDYYRVEDTAGRRYWICRLLSRERDGRWYLHGLFA